MYYCYNCQRWSYYNICPYCSNCTNNPSYANPTMNYKCPSCHGEFNQPSYGNGYQSSLIPKCPWCGKEMKGL